MQLVELHILQNYPVSCLNRDDQGAPKSAEVGGCIRARCSSQAIKRPTKARMAELSPDHFGGMRSRLLRTQLVAALIDQDVSEEDATAASQAFCAKLFTKDKKAKADDDAAEASSTGNGNGDAKDKDGNKNIFYFAPCEVNAIADALIAEGEGTFGYVADNAAMKKLVTRIIKGLRNVGHYDALDIGFFGRMVAANTDLNIEGAALFSHALSTHAITNEQDYYTAVDDIDPNCGAGYIGVNEFNAACYYRYVALNVDLLRQNLQVLEPAEVRQAIKLFVEACLTATIGKRHNSFSSASLPVYVIGVTRTGAPLSLWNAFDQPVKTTNGYIEDSIKRLEDQLETSYGTWGITGEIVRIPDNNLTDFVDAVTRSL